MSNLIIYDDDTWSSLLPLTFNKPVCEIYIGKGTIREKWESLMGLKASYITQDHLAGLYPLTIEKDNYLVNGSTLPTKQLAEQVSKLRSNEALMDSEGELIAARFPEHQFDLLSSDQPIDELNGMPISPNIFTKINSFGDFMELLDETIQGDSTYLDLEQYSQNIPDSYKSQNVSLYVHEQAIIDPCYLDTRTGPIIIDAGVQIMAGSVIKGPCYIGKNSVVKMSSIIYGPFSSGPFCVLGGEIKSSLFQAYSNKGHFGYIGNSIIGSFCNLGAGTSASNLKNTLTRVHLWDYQAEKFVDSGRLKFGLIMGDFCKTAIHTAFNTGTIVGMSCNIYSKGFPRKFIPSFSWGGSSGYIKYELEKALSVASSTKGLKGLEMTESEKNMIAAVYKMTEKFRSSYK